MHQSKAEWQQADSANGHHRKRHNAEGITQTAIIQISTMP